MSQAHPKLIIFSRLVPYDFNSPCCRGPKNTLNILFSICSPLYGIFSEIPYDSKDPLSGIEMRVPSKYAPSLTVPTGISAIAKYLLRVATQSIPPEISF